MIEPLRFLDVPPRSRNPELANILSKFHITESRGTGIEKVVYSLEEAHLPTVEILSITRAFMTKSLNIKPVYHIYPTNYS